MLEEERKELCFMHAVRAAQTQKVITYIIVIDGTLGRKASCLHCP